MNIFFLMNGNIFNYTLALEPYSFNGYKAFAIPPMPPGYASLFVQSYMNAYNTAFNQSNRNYQKALNNYLPFTSDSINNNFIPGTFGYDEGYSSINNSQSNITIHQLQNELNVYYGQPYLFMSTGSGGGSGFMYLEWIIVTYGVPYVIGIS